MDAASYTVYRKTKIQLRPVAKDNKFYVYLLSTLTRKQYNQVHKEGHTVNIKGPLFDTNLVGVTLAQMVKASVGQADVQRFEPYLGHNVELRCVSCKLQAFRLPLAQTTMAKLAISLSGLLGRYTNEEYSQSLYLRRRGQLLF